MVTRVRCVTGVGDAHPVSPSVSPRAGPQFPGRYRSRLFTRIVGREDGGETPPGTRLVTLNTYAHEFAKANHDHETRPQMEAADGDVLG
jgi:hypothetical protein